MMINRTRITAVITTALLIFTATRGISTSLSPLSLMDLGTFGGGESAASDVNGNGMVTGYAGSVSGNVHAFAFDSALHDLGTLGGPSSYGVAINSAGQIAGNADVPGFGSHATFWDSGGIHDLGTLGGAFSFAYAINDSGAVAGDSLKTGGSNHAFLFTVGAMHDLGTLGGDNSYTAAMNSAGQVAGQSDTTSGDSHAFRYDGTSMMDLGTLGGSSSTANAINAAGSVVGNSDTAAGEIHAFLFDGTMLDLGTLGGMYSSAKAINDSGQVVGISHVGGSEFHAFLFDGVSMHDLGTLGGGYSSAQSINNHGDIVGQSSTAGGEYHACLWDSSGIHDLGTLGGTIGNAIRINEIGVIAGNATLPADLHSHGFRLGDYTPATPSDTTPPVTVATVSPAANSNGWMKAPATVSLLASDTESGVAQINYVGSGAGAFAATSTASNPAMMTVQAKGETTVSFFATDKAGNLEQPQSVTIKIDPDAPIVDAAVAIKQHGHHKHKMVDVQLSGRISDALSGVDASSATFTVQDEYGEVQPSGSIQLGAGGKFTFTLELCTERRKHDRDGRQYKITLGAMDNAGNAASKTISITLPDDD